MKIFVSGMPGVGKTTLILKVSEALKSRGWRIGGIITQEVRERGKRVGFKIIALDSGEEGILAWEGFNGPKVGKYGVNLKDLEEIGVKAVERAINDADLIIIDEIGAMELKSRKFGEIVEKALKSDKHLLAVVHRRLTRKYSKYGMLYILTRENRERVLSEILEFFNKPT